MSAEKNDWQSRMEEFAANFSGTVRRDAVLAEYTSWRIGGPADWLLEPDSSQAIIDVLDFCRENDIPLTVIGRGSNLLVSDWGLPGVVLRIGDNLSYIRHSSITETNMLTGESKVKYGLLEVGAGQPLAALSRQTAEWGLTGLEWACGIPGNMGGALVMNAGAYGASIGPFVTAVHVVAYTGSEKRKAALQVLSGERLNFRYRSGCLPTGVVAYQVDLLLEVGDKEKSLHQINEILTARRQSQPLEYPSAGSVFRNPEGSHAGYLIEQAGCKGLTVGGAQVSPKHANFIVNLGGATAADVLALIKQVREIVLAKTGYALETEVRLLGRQSD